MYGRRPFLLALSVAVSGCSLITNRSREPVSTLSLTIQNERRDPIDVTVTITDQEDAVIDEETDRLDASVGRTFEFDVSEQGDYTVTVSGADWQTELAWNATTCVTLDSTVRLTEDSVENSGECVNTR